MSNNSMNNNNGNSGTNTNNSNNNSNNTNVTTHDSNSGSLIRQQDSTEAAQRFLKHLLATERTPNGVIKKDSLKKIYNLLENMKKNGQDASNNQNYKLLNEFLKKQLLIINAMKQRQNLISQQQQQQQQQLPQQSHNISQPQLQQQQPQPQPQQPQSQPMISSLFAQDQKDRLKAQIYAYKFHIAKGQAPPLPLLNCVSGSNVSGNLKQYEIMYMNQTSQQQQQQSHHHQQQSTPQPTVPTQQPIKLEQATQPPVIPATTTATTTSTSATTIPKPQPNRLASQISSRSPVSIAQNGFPHAGAVQQLYSTQTVSLDSFVTRPKPMDISLLYAERERRIQLKKKNKHAEYKSIITNPNTSHYEKIQATIGMKMLDILPLQKKLRADILNETKALEQNRSNSIRSQKTSKQLEKERRQTDKKKKMTEKEEQNKKILERRKFLNDVIANKKNIKEFYSKHRKKPADKINAQLVAEFEKRSKRQKEREKREKKARLEMLKGNDIEAYKRAIKDTKNDRLNELIQQTDECLRGLGATLIKERAEKVVEEEDEEVVGKFVAQDRQNSGGYYKVAHRLTEIIDKQPSLLKGGDLKEYQLQGLQWMVSLYNNRLNGILADEMGLGKTIQTIALLSYLLEYKNNTGPHLVIVPLSTIDNWKNEFEKWSPTLEVVVYGGTPTERKKIQQNQFRNKKFNVVLTQYEFISRKTDMKHLKKIDWSYIIIDEGHRIKNSNCKLVVTLHNYKSKHRLLLTGTPLQNELKELWALLNFLLPKVFDSHVNFEQWFNTGLSDKVDVENEELFIIINRLHQVLQPFLLRREKADVLSQLPEKVEKIIYCDISDIQRKYYDQIKQKRIVVNDGKSGRKTTQNLMNPVMQLRKACNHPFIFMDDWTQHFDERDLIRASGKFELLDRMLPKLIYANHKSLIFSQMTQVLDLMEEYFRYKNFKFMRLDGDVKAEERGKLVKAFNHPDSDIYLFILSTRAGGLGLNLQAADTVIIFDSDWNPQQDLQAMARAHRIGQKNPVRVFTLITATVFEQEVLRRAQEKRNAEAKIIGAGKFNQNATDSERKELLQQLLASEEADRKFDVPSDEALNEMMARSEEEFELFQKMDEERRAEEERYWKSLNRAVPPKLMSEAEFPDWLAKSDEIIQEATRDTMGDYGRGQRYRSQVVYDDGLGDEEFLASGSENEDIGLEDEDSSVPSRAKRRREIVLEDEEDDGDEDEDFGSKSRRSSKRQKKTPAKSTPTTNSRAARGKKKNDKQDGAVEDDSNIQFVSDLQKHLYEIYKRMIALRSKDGHLACELFMELPHKKTYADYYQLIKHPICLNTIKQRILSNAYPNVEAMQADVTLMVTNAQTYNQEGSMVFNDSLDIMAEFFNSVILLQQLANQQQQQQQLQQQEPAVEQTIVEQQRQHPSTALSFDEDQDAIFHDDVSPPFFE